MSRNLKNEAEKMVEPNMDKFAAFILCHGRPDYNDTIESLRRCGYTGKCYIICDNLDSSLDLYIKKYGADNVFVFNKAWSALNSDPMNNFNDRCSPLFARNVTFDIAKELDLDCFLVLDDDYQSFCHKQAEREMITKRLDDVFFHYLCYLLNSPIKCIAFSQGGDHIGGYKPSIRNYKRKAMNAFFCKTNEPFIFYGMINDDVNMYVINGMRGDIYLTPYCFMLHQAQTQQNTQGLTEIYQKYGTYVKSFYTIMGAPSSTLIRLMGEKYPRLHHSVRWANAVPCIINERYKK